MTAHYGDYPEGKFVTIPNGYDPDDFDGGEDSARTPSERFTITHTGTIGYNRTPRHVFLAVQRLIASGTIPCSRLRIVLVGDSAEAEGRPVAAMVHEHGLDTVVQVSPPVTRDQAIRDMRNSHLLLVLAHDWVLQIPAKVYHYLAVGKPMLALAPEGATADLVRRSGVGTVVHPYDVDGIASAIGLHFAHFQRSGPLSAPDPSFVVQFDRLHLTSMLIDLLEAVGHRTQSRSVVTENRVPGAY